MDVMAGSMRQRGTESWELRVHVGRDPETGKKQYATKTVRGSRREAERALARLVADVEDGAVAVRAGTVAELCERWFSQVEPTCRPRPPMGIGSSSTAASSRGSATHRSASSEHPISTGGIRSSAAEEAKAGGPSHPTP